MNEALNTALEILSNCAAHVDQKTMAEIGEVVLGSALAVTIYYVKNTSTAKSSTIFYGNP